MKRERETAKPSMLQIVKQLENRSRIVLIAIALLIIAVIGLVDYLTGHEISFSVFYLLGVALAVWFIGKWFGALVSVLSVAVWVVGDIASGARFSSPLIPIWNAAILLTFYLVVVWLLARLRSFHHNLEGQVRQRTTALTEEMTERERLERELLEISEREQRRIGQDLHDGLCQHLTGATLAGQVLEEKLAALNLSEAADANKVVEIVEEGINLSRRLAKGLYPVEMEADGLMLALEEFAATSSELFKVSCRFDCDSPVLIHDPATAGHLYRIAQEAVGNAIKHGKAGNILIRLDVSEESTVLSIKDDGVGLPEPLPENRGLGLRIMAHRSAMISGVFSARRDETGGTLIACEIHAKSNPKQFPP
ncbi:MAG TPA: ATP-binding protein [Candidatus Dormibacteraeota bacterium]|jgi:signal transduction histidine kinase|nr:ATP-binding protein [Candidatus Dormibacteraeota bacterium]